MQFQAFNKILIDNQTIKQYIVEGVVMGYQFNIRYPSYRGTYLSCIEKINILVDEQPIDSKKITFTLNGIQYLIEDLKNLYKVYWYVLDYATITVLLPGGVLKGEHSVTVDMKHRIPYAGYGGKYLSLPSVVTKTLIAE